jgi:hypothetical protein
MVKIFELAIKIVIYNKRKWLLRLNQTVMEVGTASFTCAFVTRTPPGQKQASNPTDFCKWNVETPYRSLRDSRLQSQPLAVREQERGKSERRPVIGRIGVEISPYAKACRLPYGLSSQESF